MGYLKDLLVNLVDGDVQFTIGELDLSGLPLLQQGPIIECLTPGCADRMYVAWVPVLFEGKVDDPLNMCRIVRDGEAEQFIGGENGDK